MRRRVFLRLAALFAAAGRPAVPRAAEGAADETASGAVFAPVRPGRRLVFPEDHGAHPDFRTEWWYATGWLERRDETRDSAPADDATRAPARRIDFPPATVPVPASGTFAAAPLGFQATFFRVRTGIGEDNPSSFAPRQLILAHAAIADPAHGRLRHAERSARAGHARAGFATGRTDVWIGDWRLEQTADGYRAAVQADDFAYALDLVRAGPPMLNGDAGFSRKAADPRHASYYYSRPQLEVAGNVTVSGRARAVRGRAWLDHEWSSEVLPPGAQGWDWIGINLDDGSALMAFRMRGTDGTTLWAAATLRDADGTLTLPPSLVRFEPTAEWRSPRTAIAWPVGWQVAVAGRRFDLRALMPDQELDSRRSTGAIYWEGAVRLSEGGREVGRGYLEMTGYGERIRVG